MALQVLCLKVTCMVGLTGTRVPNVESDDAPFSVSYGVFLEEANAI